MGTASLLLQEMFLGYLKLEVTPKDLTGRKVLITGGNDGVGLYTAITLAKMGATIIIASRNTAKSEAAVVKIKEESGNQNVTFRLLDLGSIEGVKQFCDDFKKEHTSLDLLINNAAAIFYTFGTTEDGLEKTFHVNHLGPFILTLHLLPVIEKGNQPRIVNLSSLGHNFVTLTLPEDLHTSSDKYQFLDAYCRSKLMNLLFTKELARRLESKNIPVVAVHPGFVKSNLGLDNFPNVATSFIFKLMLYPFQFAFARWGEAGAMTSVFAAIDDSVVNGEYYDSCRVGEIQPQGKDMKLARSLWNYSADLAKIDPNIV